MSVASENRDEKIKVILGRLDELDSQLRAYWEDMKVQLRELKKTREETANPGDGAKGAPEDLYKQGFDAFQKGAYRDAVPLFTQFVQENPHCTACPQRLLLDGRELYEPEGL